MTRAEILDRLDWLARVTERNIGDGEMLSDDVPTLLAEIRESLISGEGW